MDSPYIHPRKFLTHMPCVTATPQQLWAILHGQKVHLPDFSDAKLVKVFQGQDTLVAICERIAGPLFRPHTVLYRPDEIKY